MKECKLYTESKQKCAIMPQDIKRKKAFFSWTLFALKRQNHKNHKPHRFCMWQIEYERKNERREVQKDN